jgi:RimJ/RimL family protein N-acetyltransferase
MVKIIFNNFLIRKFIQKDIDNQYISWFNDKTNLKYSRHKNKIYTKKQLSNYLKNHEKNLNSLFLVCFDRKKKIKVATLTVYIDKHTKVANVGILIGENKYLGKGLSKKILDKVFNYIFNKLNLNRIIMGTDVRNKPMIKSCFSLGMKKRNEYKFRGKKIISFQKSKNNLSYIGVVCKDLGAATQIFHYIKKDKKNNYLLFLQEPSKKLFIENKNSNQIICNNINKIYMCCDYVLFGTGSSNFEKENMFKISKFNLKINAVVDHLTNFKKRFNFKKYKIMPDKILVFDSIIFKHLIKFEKIIKLPNYYLKDIKKKFVNFKIQNKNLLFIGEPFNKAINKNSIDQIGIRYLAETLNKFKFLNKMNLVIRLHPKQFLKDYLGYKKIFQKYNPQINVILDSNKELYKSIKSAKFVFGITSYALLLSANLGVKTFHCIKNDQKIRPLPSKNILSLNKLIIKRKK